MVRDDLCHAMWEKPSKSGPGVAIGFEHDSELRHGKLFVALWEDL